MAKVNAYKKKSFLCLRLKITRTNQGRGVNVQGIVTMNNPPWREMSFTAIPQRQIEIERGVALFHKKIPGSTVVPIFTQFKVQQSYDKAQPGMNQVLTWFKIQSR